jgi:hypothetical protein
MTGSDERLNFDQKSRRASMEMDLFLTGKLMTHQFLSGYEYLYDASALEQELSPYQNKTAFLGYGAIFQPLDSLSISFRARVHQQRAGSLRCRGALKAMAIKHLRR